jgi:uncharacterized protein (TIGR02996 family)
MPTADDFLRAILADPDADGPRLAYADWLDGTGDPTRAEFIRVQCALAALPAGDREFHSLRDRERALLDRHREEWLRPIHDLFPGAGPRPGGWRRWFQLWTPGEPLVIEFRRGFVEVLEAGSKAYVRCADDLARFIPLRNLGLWFGQTPPLSEALATALGFPHLSRLTALSLTLHPSIRLRAVEMGQLAECPHLSGMRKLSLNGGLDHTAARVLADSGLLARLDALRIDSSTEQGGDAAAVQSDAEG